MERIEDIFKQLSTALRIAFLYKIVFFIACFSITTGWAKTITVCNTCEITSLKKAIAVAEAEDTIFVKEGTYNEFNIIVDKPLTIKGENFPVIDGEDQGKSFVLLQTM